MRCPECHVETSEGAAFCLACGARLTFTCRHCGAPLPPEARYCVRCGGSQSPSGMPNAPGYLADRLRRLVPQEYAERLAAAPGPLIPERRQVTILFCDVRGSSTIAEHLDPEDVLEIMTGAFDVLIPPVHQYEGTLARLMGDAILAFFGAPIAHENDPELAVRAALEIVTGAKAYAARLFAEREITGFDVRVGINTGIVVVGEVGSDLRAEYTAMGDAVNLAARLE